MTALTAPGLSPAALQSRLLGFCQRALDESEAELAGVKAGVVYLRAEIEALKAAAVANTARLDYARARICLDGLGPDRGQGHDEAEDWLNSAWDRMRELGVSL